MTGAEMIVAERKRQIEAEGWDAEHDDDEHAHEELVGAAICYAVNKGDVHDGRVVTGYGQWVGGYFGSTRDLHMSAPVLWPWSDELDKRVKHDRIRSLAIAGALIAAEIDRLQRKGGA